MNNNSITLDSGMTTTTNCWPYNPPNLSGCITLSGSPFYELKIRQAKNGFIVDHNGHEHVFETLKSMIKFIEELWASNKK